MTTRRIGISVTTGMILLISFALKAQTANGSVEALIQGRHLAQQILEQWPTENFTNTGVLIIDDGHGRRSKVPIRFHVTFTPTNWSSIYEAYFTNRTESLAVVHSEGDPFRELVDGPDVHPVSPEGIPNNNTGPIFPDLVVYHIIPYDTYDHAGVLASNSEAVRVQFASFAGSDFSVDDLRLEFFHWLKQKILKPYEMRRGRSCKVLESVNPNPVPNGYSRVVSWIDNETLGIVQAEAYDAKGKLLKEFYPKDFKKVNGRWEVGEMEMINDQTGSRSWIKFDLNKNP